jgi:hypothetical protein
MKYFFILIFLYSINIWGQTRLTSDNYYHNFPIEKMIIGEWFLEKIEIIGLNKNDSTSIVSLESGKDKIVFYDKTYKTFPDTSESRFFRPNYEFYYKIKKEQYHILNQIVITDKKNKKTFETYTVLLYTFNNLTIEDFEVNSRLGNTVSKFRYYYKRKSDSEPNIIGKWILNDTVDYYLPSTNDSIWHTFVNYNKLNQDSLSKLRVKTAIEFKMNNTYSGGIYHSYLSSGVLDGVYLGGTYIIDSNDKKIYFISKHIYVYEFTIDNEENLKIRYLEKK